jgi:hypothetical protein
MDARKARQLAVEQCEPGGNLRDEFLTAADVMFSKIGTDAPCGCCRMTTEEAALEGKENFREDCDVDNWLDDFGYTDGKDEAAMLLDAVYDYLLAHFQKPRYWVNRKNAISGGWSYIEWDGSYLLQIIPGTGSRTTCQTYKLADVVYGSEFWERSSKTQANDWCLDRDRDATTDSYKTAGKPASEKIMADLEGAAELRSAVRDTAISLDNTADNVRSRMRGIARKSTSIGESIESAKSQLPAIITLAQRNNG